MRATTVSRTAWPLVILVLLCGLGERASAAQIIDIVGREDWVSGSTAGTLTGGFITGDLQWTHTYTPVPVGDITSAKLTIDTIDGESFGQLSVYAGTSTAGTYIGPAPGNDNGTPGPWRPVGDPLARETTFTLSASLYANLADGTFDLYGSNVQMGGWGSNRSRLVIDYIPEPAALSLLAVGAVALARRRRR